MSFYTKAFLTSVIYLFAFLLLFVLFQNNTFYSNTLGRISQNYEHVGEFGVQKVSKPFTQIKNENFERWDACIYQCIKDRHYINEEGYYGYVRGAFFPLFPYTWKLLHLNHIGISLLNYFLFALAVMLLVNNFLKAADNIKLLTFLLFISLPSTVVFSIPYTEAFFIITASLMFMGITKNNYKLYFIAALLLAMVRPATLFVFLSIFSIEVIILLLKKHHGDF